MLYEVITDDVARLFVDKSCEAGIDVSYNFV